MNQRWLQSLLLVGTKIRTCTSIGHGDRWSFVWFRRPGAFLGFQLWDPQVACLASLSLIPRNAQNYSQNSKLEDMESSLTYIEKLVDFVLIEVAIDGLYACEVFLADANGAHLGLNSFLVRCDTAAHIYLNINL